MARFRSLEEGYRDELLGINSYNSWEGFGLVWGWFGGGFGWFRDGSGVAWE